MSDENISTDSAVSQQPQEAASTPAPTEQAAPATPVQASQGQGVTLQPIQTQQQPAQSSYSQQQAAEAVESRGFNYDALSAEFEANGDLLPDTRAKLAKQGLDKRLVDNYIEGQKALVQKAMDDVASVVGGRDQMNTVVQWARANLTADEKKSIDAVKDPAVLKIILKNLEQRMNDNDGQLPQQLQGKAGGSKGNYFESMAQVEEAINDPRYSTDPAYRNKVARKLTASRKAGILEIK